MMYYDEWIGGKPKGREIKRIKIVTENGREEFEGAIWRCMFDGCTFICADLRDSYRVEIRKDMINYIEIEEIDGNKRYISRGEC